jgi:ABC-type lipoprotein release transport system permease subunit
MWTNGLVVCIMALTFLNLVVITGILVGLIQGAVVAVKAHYLGDIFVSTLKEKPYIERSSYIVATTRGIPGVIAVSPRYLEGGIVEANYKTKKRQNDLGEKAGTTIAGIDPEEENAVTDLKSKLIEGSYLTPDDFDQVVVGALLLKQYLDFDSTQFPALSNVGIGTKIRLTIGDDVREVTVKGIVKSKVDEIDRRVFMVDRQLRGIAGRSDYNVDEIAIRLAPGTDATAVKEAMLRTGASTYAKVQTAEEGEPKFIKDMKQTFDTLGNLISSIGLVVATITIFIVIFINAITRRKYIGIMKGIGVSSRAIEYAYVMQSAFYAIMGTALGSLFVFGFLKPYLDIHPINFPFSDGILVATVQGTFIRFLILLATTIIAGYVPARMITSQNTLDAILNR